jgi:hypothetical protein
MAGFPGRHAIHAGEGIRKIAEVRGRSYGFMYNLLKESGVSCGDAGEIPTPRSRRPQ